MMVTVVVVVVVVVVVETTAFLSRTPGLIPRGLEQQCSSSASYHQVEGDLEEEVVAPGEEGPDGRLGLDGHAAAAAALHVHSGAVGDGRGSPSTAPTSPPTPSPASRLPVALSWRPRSSSVRRTRMRMLERRLATASARATRIRTWRASGERQSGFGTPIAAQPQRPYGFGPHRNNVRLG
ncbi:unnamed protein product [Boreogadus saida]